MEFALSAYIIGFLSSVVTELFKLFPALNLNPLTKVLTAITVMVIGTLWSIGFNVTTWDWNLFGQVVVWSFVNYKMIVAPVAGVIGMRTQ